ncbi:MAG: bifunctional GNAT family N-acetyltransferase/class I SAM-dependent methyltransferase [bacterium]
MQNERLYRKYLSGRHWDAYPTSYSQRFADFLLSNGFSGRLVDLGCGSGSDVHVFFRRGIDVLGIDLSEDEIARARSRHPHCRFEVGDVERMSLEDRSVGALFMINVVHYLNQRKALREAYRILRPGGFFLVHFNTLIADRTGRIDYAQGLPEILSLVRDFEIVQKNPFMRVDLSPIIHTHSILELVLRKPVETA